MMSTKDPPHLAELLSRVVGDDVAHFMSEYRRQGILVRGGPKKSREHDHLRFSTNDRAQRAMPGGTQRGSPYDTRAFCCETGE